MSSTAQTVTGELLTNSNVAQRTEAQIAAQFKPGNSLGGRPKGTRNKLSEQFLLDMHKVWTEVTEIEGKASVMALDVIRAVATKEPSKMLSAMVQVLPKDFQVSVDIDHVNWVISATPKVFERDSSEWLTEHGLQGETDETNGEAKGKQGNGQDDST